MSVHLFLNVRLQLNITHAKPGVLEATLKIELYNRK